MSEKREKVKTLREEMGKIVNDQQAIQDKAEGEKRSLTADENTNWENMDVRFNEIQDEIKTLNQEIEADEKDELRKQKLQERQDWLKTTQSNPARPNPNNDNSDKRDKQTPEVPEYGLEKRFLPAMEKYRVATNFRYSDKEFLEAYRSYLVNGLEGVSGDHRSLLESRALQVDDDASGGYLVAPEKLVMSLIQRLNNIVFVRGLATVFPVPNAVSLGFPAIDQRIDDLDWTAEIKAASRDTSLKLEKRELRPHPLAKEIQVSKPLLRKSFMPVEDIIRGEFEYKFGTVTENGYLNGSGVNQPLGVFTASPAGISTSRDSSTGNTNTAITADGLINCQMNLKKQYRNANCRWAFHRDAIKMIRKLKDGNGDYLWRSGLAEGIPPNILNVMYEESEYAPSTFTTGLYVGIIGDWSTYYIADAMNMTIQVLTELYARTNQNGYIARAELDGMPVLEEAWSRLQLT